MLFFLPPLLWLGLLSLPVPAWAHGRFALAYPYLLSSVWFAVVTLLML